MDRRAMARAQRMRLVADAIDEELGRETSLVAQLEETAAELESPIVDDEVFARMAAEDVDIVREVLLGHVDMDGIEGEDDGWVDPEPAEDGDETDNLLSEMARLEQAVAESRRRREALERYAAALEDETVRTAAEWRAPEQQV